MLKLIIGVGKFLGRTMVAYHRILLMSLAAFLASFRFFDAMWITLAIMIIYELVLAYFTRHLWLWPIVYQIETQWYGKPIHLMTKEERAKLHKSKAFLFINRRARK